MSQADSPRRLSLNVPAQDVDLEEFMGAVRDLLGVVNEVGGTLVGDAFKSLRWRITTLRGGSAVLEAEPVPDAEVDHIDVERVLAASRRGLEELTQSARRPAYFNDAALSKARSLACRFAKNEGGARAGLGAATWYLTPAVVRNVEQLTRGVSKSIGSLEGKLVRLEEGRGIEFVILEAITGRKVACHVPDHLVEEAIRGFRRRVNVFGIITETAERLPKSIAVESIRIFPDEESLPTSAELRGILRPR